MHSFDGSSCRRGRRQSIVRATFAVSEDYGCSRSDAVWVEEFTVILQGSPRQISPFFFFVIVFIVMGLLHGPLLRLPPRQELLTEKATMSEVEMAVGEIDEDDTEVVEEDAL